MGLLNVSKSQKQYLVFSSLPKSKDHAMSFNITGLLQPNQVHIFKKYIISF
jgi:hypothetical protein